MAPDKPESWGFQGLAGFLRDLGPTEGEKKVYRKFKELYQKATTMSAGEPPDEWRPPGQRSKWDIRSTWNPDQQLRNLAADSVETTLKLRQNKPIHKPSDKEEECHRKLLTLAIKMGDMMKLQAEQVRIDTANEDLQKQAHFVTKDIQTWADVAIAPDCGPNLFNQVEAEINWEPTHLIKKYHKTMSSPKAVALVDGYSPGNDLLLLPSTGGWEAALDVLHKEKILEWYPSMEEPWCEAVALRLKVVTRRKTNGRRDKEITEVTMAPMFGPEYRHYEKRITITPQNYEGYEEHKLELAPFHCMLATALFWFSNCARKQHRHFAFYDFCNRLAFVPILLHIS